MYTFEPADLVTFFKTHNKLNIEPNLKFSVSEKEL